MRQVRLKPTKKRFRRRDGETPFAHAFLNRVSIVNSLLSKGAFDAADEWLTELNELIPGHPLLHYLQGRISYGRGDLDDAQSELQSYLSALPDDMQGQAILGAVNFSQNYLRQAEMYLSRAVREQVGGEMTRRLLAETQLRLDKPADALQSLTELGGADSQDPVLLTMMGRAELGLGNSDAAIEYLERSVAADPDNTDASISLAAVLLAAGDYDRVVTLLEELPEQEGGGYRRESLLIAAHLKNDDVPAALDQAGKIVADNPQDPGAYAVSGNLYQSVGQLDQARDMFRQALHFDEKDIPALYGLGRLALNSGDQALAEKWLSAAIDADPAFLPALALLAELLSENGRYEDALPKIRAAADLKPGALGPRLLLARTALANNQYDMALSIVAEARELHPGEPRLDHVEGMARAAQGQTEVALRLLDSAAAALPGDARVQYDVARQHLLNGNFRDAIRYAKNFRELNPDSISGLAVHIEALAKSGDTEGARSALEGYKSVNDVRPLTAILAGDIEMIDENPEVAVSHYEDAASGFWNRLIVTRLVQAYQTVDPQRAAAPIERWLTENPNDSEMRRMLGQVLEAAGDASAAIRQYESVLAENADDPIALNNLAWQYSVDGREGAIELAERAHRIAPENGNISDTLGWILYKSGDFERAEEILRRAAAQAPDNPDIKYHLASVLLERGNESEADRLLRETLQAFPEFSSRSDAEALLEKI